jgi:D-3-phosphoglycerate dehydrogenase / 2-oxoglutarate reductase
MTKPKVLISDKMDPNAERILRERGCDVDVITGKTPDELKEIIGQYDGLAIRSSTKVTKEILDAATNLKVVGRAGIGVDNVDIPYASSKGVVVMNTPFGNSITTAEHAIALMFALARQIPDADTQTQEGKWPKNAFMGVEVTGKTLGLIGAGNIGSIVASRALGLRMKVVAYDPFLTEERAVEMGVEKADLDTLLSRADFITLHTPLTDETRNILSRERLEKTKKGVRIVNCARGGLIDEVALKDLLDNGHIAGAALRQGTAGARSPAVRHQELHLHPAPRRLDQRSAGQRRAAGGRTDRRLPRQRRRDQRAQRAFAERRGSAQAAALHGSRREARQPGRPAGPRRAD